MTSTTTTGAGYSAEPGSLYASLVSYWKLGETSGTRADSVGNHDLTDENTVLYSTGGKFGNCADLEAGTSEYLERANASAADLLGVSGDWTFSTWVKPETTASGAKLVSVWPGMGSSNRAWMIDIKKTGDDYFWSGAVGGSLTRATDTDTSNCAAGTWAHIILQHNDGTNVKLKVNDETWITTSYTDGIDAVNTDFRLGGRGTTFDGLIDETAFWSKALTDAECSWLYSSGYGFSLY